MAQPDRVREIIQLRSAMAAGSMNIPHDPLHLIDRLLACGRNEEAVRAALAAARALEASGYIIHGLVALRAALFADPTHPDAHELFWRLRSHVPPHARATLDRRYAELTARGDTQEYVRSTTNIISLLPRLR